MNNPPKKRGRPRSASSITSANTNYQALAWQVKQRLQTAEREGRKLTIKVAVREEMLASVKLRNTCNPPIREGRIDPRFETAYTEVRKLLKKWEEQEKEPR